MTADFSRLLEPRGVAVIGASEDARKIGGQPMRFLTEFGYAGHVYPVNPRYQTVRGLRCYANAGDLPQPCDVGLIAVPAASVPMAIRDLGRAGVPYAIVLSAGFRELGERGMAMQQALDSALADTGIRIIGPNCQGVMNLRARAYLGFGHSFSNPDLKPGPVSMVTQSGGFGYSVVSAAQREGIGFSYVFSTGNEANISSLEMMASLIERPEVEVLVTYMEGLSDGRALLALGERALQLGKPILVWKVGNTRAGQRAVASHTANLTASAELYRAAFERGGFVQIRDIDDLIDTLHVFLGGRYPRGSGVTILTTSGGAGVLMADRCEEAGLELPLPSQAAVEAIRPVAPDFASLGNPVDVTAHFSGAWKEYNQIIRTLLADPTVDILIARSIGGANAQAWGAELLDILKGTDKPVVISQNEPPERIQAMIAMLREARVPLITTPARCAAAAGALSGFAARLRAHAARPAPGERCVPFTALELPATGGTLGEHRSKAILAAYGIPVTREVLFSPEEIGRLSSLPFDAPYAVKVESPDIPHKTEAGCVRLGIEGLLGLKAAAREVEDNARRYRADARIDGILVTEMARGTEIIVGAVDDPIFGPVVMFGLGGVFTELLRDVTHAFAPFDLAEAHAMIGRIRSAPLLTGYRGRPPLDVDALAQVLSRVSWLIADHAGRIAEIDLNPLFIGERGIVAADALVALKPAA
jgi:acyl-CoA synthetase (NDP forming)